MLTALGLLLAAAIATPAPSADAVRPRLELRVRIDGNVGLTPADLNAMALEIRRIWAPALDIVVTLPNEMSSVVAVDTIPLVITNRMLDTSESSGLGWIAFTGGEPQPEITVSAAMAKRLLQNGSWQGVPFSSRPPRVAQVFMQRALARAASHEIGHYLLRSRAHTRRGLMRAVFTVNEIMDVRESLTRLEPDAMARLQQDDRRVAQLRAGRAVD